MLQQFVAVLRIAGSRAAWFLLAALLTVAVSHLSTGVTPIPGAQPTVPPGMATVQAPRNDPTQPFRVLPLESRQTQPAHTWSASRYGRALGTYVKGLTTGSLSIHRPSGKSGDTEPLLPRIAAAWGASFRLYISALGAGVAAGLLLAALSLGTRLGRSLSMGLSVAGLALPDFFLIVLGQMATILTYREFGVRLWSVLGAQGTERGWILPLLALSIGPMAYTARLTATALDEVMREDYIRTARAKGIPEVHVILGHALRNVAPRVIDGLPALLNATLSSLVIVEVLTASQGLGSLLMSFGSPQVLATAGLIFCAWFAVMDGLASSLRALFSPRLKEVGA